MRRASNVYFSSKTVCMHRISFTRITYINRKSLACIVVWTAKIRWAVLEEVDAGATQAAVQLVVVQHDCNERVDVSKISCEGHLLCVEVVRQKPKCVDILWSSVSGTAAVHMISCLKVVCAVPFSRIEDSSAARRESLVGSTTSARWTSALALAMMSGSFLNMFSRARPSSVILVSRFKKGCDPRILAKHRRIFRLVQSAHGLRMFSVCITFQRVLVFLLSLSRYNISARSSAIHPPRSSAAVRSRSHASFGCGMPAASSLPEGAICARHRNGSRSTYGSVHRQPR